MLPLTGKYVPIRRSDVGMAVHDQSKIIKRLPNTVSKKHFYLS